MGIESKLRPEIFELFIVLIKCINIIKLVIPISFSKLYKPDYQTYYINLQSCLQIYDSNFDIYMFSIENLSSLLKECEVYTQEIKQKLGLNIEKKFEIFLLNRFINNSEDFITEQIRLYKSDNLNEQNIEVFRKKFLDVNEIYNISIERANEIFSKYFGLVGEVISMQMFFEFYIENYSFKMKISTFLEISLNSIIALYKFLESHCVKIYEKCDTKKEGLMNYKEFQDAILIYLGGSERQWKISDFFRFFLFNLARRLIT